MSWKEEVNNTTNLIMHLGKMSASKLGKVLVPLLFLSWHHSALPRRKVNTGVNAQRGTRRSACTCVLTGCMYTAAVYSTSGSVSNTTMPQEVCPTQCLRRYVQHNYYYLWYSAWPTIFVQYSSWPASFDPVQYLTYYYSTWPASFVYLTSI